MIFSVNNLLTVLAITANVASAKHITFKEAVEVEDYLHPQKASIFPTRQEAKVTVAAATNPEIRGDNKPSGELIPGTIYYHGGPVMTSSLTNIYLVWYGSWSTQKKNIVKNFVTDFSESSWMSTQIDYYQDINGDHSYPGTKLKLKVNVDDKYSSGKSITNVPKVLAKQLKNKKFPADPNGLYVLLTSPDVSVEAFGSAFCEQFCGFHSYVSNDHGKALKYMFIGDTARCPNACTWPGKLPSGDNGIDGLLSVFAHEITEAMTDPELNAWFDNSGWENADKCAWDFGETYTAANGGIANTHLGSHDYLLQRNWLRQTDQCALQYVAPNPPAEINAI